MAEPALFGRYRLLAPAGSGGSASVWRAFDELTGEEVAVKRLHPVVVADEAARRRLEREFRALRRLRGPYIAAVRDLHVEDGDAAIVLDYVPGRSLAERIAAEGRIPPREAVAIVADVASGLAAAHDAGIVHRDVTPGNILLAEDGGARLTDFGIALGGDDGSAATAVTATGLLVGTPRYVAPEQLRGEPATPASDLFALAAVTYEMLAGRPAFAATAPVALAEEQLTGPPPIDGIPSELDLAVRRALSPDPAHRPADVDAFAAELEAAIGESLGRAVTTVMPVPVPASPPGESSAPVPGSAPMTGQAPAAGDGDRSAATGEPGEGEPSDRSGGPARTRSRPRIAGAQLAGLGAVALALVALFALASAGQPFDPSDVGPGRASPLPAAAEPTPSATPSPATAESAVPAVDAAGGKGKGNGGGKGKGPPGKDD